MGENRSEMKELTFKSGTSYTLGVEAELQTLDATSLRMEPLAPVLLKEAPAILQPRLSEEFIQSILEINTGVCFSLEDVEYDLQQTFCLAYELAEEHNCLLHVASLHPFAKTREQLLSANPRYQKIMEELQLVGRQFISQGFHVHVGMPDAETAVRVCNMLQPFLPLLLGISASSPYYQTHDTGFASYRTKLFEVLPLAGIYTHMENWQQFQQELTMLVRHGVIESYRDLWWDTRLNPTLGTLEIRICDLPGRFQDILGLVACMQSLAATLVERKEGSGPYNGYLLQANKWQAARHGLAGDYVDMTGLLGGGRLPMREAINRLLKLLEPMSVRLGCDAYLAKVERLLTVGNSADFQRRTYKETGELPEVIRKLHQEFWL